ncbi:MAG: NAD(P)H-dependent oxidoreductase [Acidimicrobiia bacterium]|nr:NAD(P)H-dependent oxidoreductase [Acidimicrobiia bacterium]
MSDTARAGNGSTVVVQCHPLDQSYNMALLEAVTTALDRTGTDHVVHRFYPDGAPPHDLVSECRHLIVVAPTWWGAMPSPVLAWIQERLGPWIDDDARYEDSPVRTVQRLTVVTSHGSSKLQNVMQGEPGLQFWKRTMLGLCAPGADFDWISLYKIDRLDREARLAFLTTVERRLVDIVTTMADTS